MQLGLG